MRSLPIFLGQTKRHTTSVLTIDETIHHQARGWHLNKEAVLPATAELQVVVVTELLVQVPHAEREVHLRDLRVENHSSNMRGVCMTILCWHLFLFGKNIMVEMKRTAEKMSSKTPFRIKQDQREEAEDAPRSSFYIFFVDKKA